MHIYKCKSEELSIIFGKEDTKSPTDVCKELNEEGNNDNLNKIVDQIFRPDGFEVTSTATETPTAENGNVQSKGRSEDRGEQKSAPHLKRRQY